MVQSFKKIQKELTVNQDTSLLRGTRIVIPAILQPRTIDITHERHQGISRTKQLFREKMWFPNIDKMLEEKITYCTTCQILTNTKNLEPPLHNRNTKSTMAEVSMDFRGPLLSGNYLFVVIDDYSRCPEVEVLKSLSHSAVIHRLDKIFSTHGIPEIAKSDNGPPFNSSAFQVFAQYLGFKHQRITPHWPQANGEVERFMRTLKKSLQSSQPDGTLWKQQLY